MLASSTIKLRWFASGYSRRATLFIFSNSLKGIEERTSDSNWVIAFLTPVFEIT